MEIRVLRSISKVLLVLVLVFDLRTYHRINGIMALLGNFSHKVIITLYCSRKELFMNVLNKKINYLKPTCMYGQGYLMNVDEARDIC